MLFDLMTRTPTLTRTDKLLLLTSLVRSDQNPPRIESFYVPGGEARGIARLLDDAFRCVGAQYGVMAEAEAQALAPYLSAISQLKCRIQGGRLHSEFLSRLNARPVSEGWNLGEIGRAHV